MHDAAVARRVRQFIAEHDLMAPGAAVLVGVSGGVDSVVLLHLLGRLGYGVTAVHVNYGLRGAAAEADEAFVRTYCAEQQVPLHVAHVDTPAHAEAHGQSIQEAARELRYDLFARRAAEAGIRQVAVGHHRDDQAETVLLNLFRGSGPEGLAGMPARRPLDAAGRVDLVRPLLAVRRADVEAYAAAEGLAWRTDASNASLKYRRGAVREAILPAVVEHFGAAAVDHIARAADYLRAYVEADLRGTVDEALARYGREEEEGGSLDVAGLRGLPEVWRGRVILEALRRWLPGVGPEAAAVAAVAALLEAQPGRRVGFGTGTVWRARGRLRFVPPAAEGAGTAVRIDAPAPGEEQAVPLPEGTLRLALLAAPPARLDGGTPHLAYLDADRLVWPLTVRPWAPGDRFQPLGLMRRDAAGRPVAQTKKVSDLLTDEKVPVHRRHAVRVLCSAGAIAWVVGHRISHAHRVRPDTRRVLRLRFEPHG